MHNASSQEPREVPNQKETYALRGSTTSTNWFAKRTAAREAAFFLPHVRAGMRLLDCGCGTGSITVGLAQAVAPGQVTALDVDADTIKAAEAHAAEQGVANIRFETASIYSIPFSDESFDAVFSHAVLEHLSDPVAALKEMHRMLKAGGVVGVRSIDLDGIIAAPEDPLLSHTVSLVQKGIQHHGGDFTVGKQLRALLNSAGFARVEASASYDSYGTPEATALWADRITDEPKRQGRKHLWIEQGWVDLDMFERIIAAWEAWGADPDAFLARPWCEAIGWKT